MSISHGRCGFTSQFVHVMWNVNLVLKIVKGVVTGTLQTRMGALNPRQMWPSGQGIATNTCGIIQRRIPCQHGSSGFDPVQDGTRTIMQWHRTICCHAYVRISSYLNGHDKILQKYDTSKWPIRPSLTKLTSAADICSKPISTIPMNPFRVHGFPWTCVLYARTLKG